MITEIKIDITEKAPDAWRVIGLCPEFVTVSGALHVYPDTGRILDTETDSLVMASDTRAAGRRARLVTMCRQLAAQTGMPVLLTDEETWREERFTPPATESAAHRADRIARAVQVFRAAESMDAAAQAEKLAAQDARGLLTPGDVTVSLVEISDTAGRDRAAAHRAAMELAHAAAQPETVEAPAAQPVEASQPATVEASRELAQPDTAAQPVEASQTDVPAGAYLGMLPNGGWWVAIRPTGERSEHFNRPDAVRWLGETSQPDTAAAQPATVEASRELAPVRKG